MNVRDTDRRCKTDATGGVQGRARAWRAASRAANCNGVVGRTRSINPRLILVHFPIDRRDLGDPGAALGVIECHDLIVWPVEVKRDKGYLLAELGEGVA
jgi:hypothetical protein